MILRAGYFIILSGCLPLLTLKFLRLWAAVKHQKRKTTANFFLLLSRAHTLVLFIFLYTSFNSPRQTNFVPWECTRKSGLFFHWSINRTANVSPHGLLNWTKVLSFFFFLSIPIYNVFLRTRIASQPARRSCRKRGKSKKSNSTVAARLSPK